MPLSSQKVRSHLESARKLWRSASLNSALNYIDNLNDVQAEPKKLRSKQQKTPSSSHSYLDRVVNFWKAELPFVPKFYSSGYGNPHAILAIRKTFEALREELQTPNYATSLSSPMQIKFSEPQLNYRFVSHRSSTTLRLPSIIPALSTRGDQDTRSGRGQAYVTQRGTFTSPWTEVLPYIPLESHQSFFELVFPESWYSDLRDDTYRYQSVENSSDPTFKNYPYSGICVSRSIRQRPLCILLAGTGEIGFSRRRKYVAKYLAQQGVATLILESPYYGLRCPVGQIRSKLKRVTDLPCLGLTTVYETLALVKWWKNWAAMDTIDSMEIGGESYNHGESNSSAAPWQECNEKNLKSKKVSIAPVTIAGVSMGGLHSCMVASLLSTAAKKDNDLAVGCVNWLGPTSATPVFTDGCMSEAIDWKMMQREAEQRKDILLTLLSRNKNDDLANDYSDDLGRQMIALVLQDACIDYFPEPKNTDAVYITRASDDSYVPEYASEPWVKQWPSIHHEKIKGGHVSGTLFHLENYRQKILNSLESIAQR